MVEEPHDVSLEASGPEPAPDGGHESSDPRSWLPLLVAVILAVLLLAGIATLWLSGMTDPR